MDFLWIGRLQPNNGMVGYYASNFTAQCTNRVMLLVCSGKTDWKTDNLISRSSEYAVYFQVCLINVLNSLKAGRTMVILSFSNT